MERTIVHLDLDTFFVSCERAVNSSLEGIPLIIGGNGGRGVVASCSYEARKFGVRSAMPMFMALRLCPQAKVIRGDMELYSKYSHIVTEIIQEKAPVMEKASVDEFYLDFTGLEKYFGCYAFASELAQRVFKETNLPISFGLSLNKTVSKIATGEGKPKGKISIEPKFVRPFLNPLSIKKIPGLGEKKYVELSRIGIRNIETLAETPIEIFHTMYGKPGIDIWHKANGIDESAVEPYVERKGISTEQTFEQDTIDIEKIKTLLVAMVEKLAFQLREEKWLTSTVVVRIKYSNFDTHTKQTKVAYTSADHILIKRVYELFDKLYDRRIRIRLVGIGFTGLVRGEYQINLFEDTTESVNLYNAIDKMKRRFGFKAVMRCAGLDLQGDKS
ncbi:DNA polymerase IV [Aurantibacillus circumpalustris]|uniref:DNA polymerase IV n=1 Tax=Aurantibacillus circumpalustris TaxID=3036359 RepID=UPI00295BAFCF|nr:DNA polymerase IV [Aurantibacillus circumpalustris]